MHCNCNLETCYRTVENIATAYSCIAYSNATVLRSQLVLWQNNSPNSTRLALQENFSSVKH